MRQWRRTHVNLNQTCLHDEKLHLQKQLFVQNAPFLLLHYLKHLVTTNVMMFSLISLLQATYVYWTQRHADSWTHRPLDFQGSRTSSQFHWLHGCWDFGRHFSETEITGRDDRNDILGSLDSSRNLESSAESIGSKQDCPRLALWQQNVSFVRRLPFGFSLERFGWTEKH